MPCPSGSLEASHSLLPEWHWVLGQGTGWEAGRSPRATFPPAAKAQARAHALPGTTWEAINTGAVIYVDVLESKQRAGRANEMTSSCQLLGAGEQSRFITRGGCQPGMGLDQSHRCLGLPLLRSRLCQRMDPLMGKTVQPLCCSSLQ